MKQIALAAALSFGMLCATAGAARANFIGLYRDSSGLECEAMIVPFQPIATYVIHKTGYSAVMGSRWKVNDASSLYQIGFSTIFAYLGEPYSDVSIPYGSCLQGDILIMTLTHMWMGSPFTCGLMEIVGAPDAGGVVLGWTATSTRPRRMAGGSSSIPRPTAPAMAPSKPRPGEA